jgi:HEAT repeat protein
VQRLLSAPHDPPTHAELTQACSKPETLLVSYATNTSLRGVLRLRAIEALGRFGDAETKRTLEERAVASGDLASIRRAALTALARVARDDAATRERVGVQALSDPDGHVRAAAVALLAGIGNASVKRALTTARDAERESFVRLAIERELAR